MLILLLLLAYLLAAAITGGWVLSATLDLLVWVWSSDPPVMTLLAAAMATGLGAALIYPRYRRGMVLTRTVLHEAPPVTPPDGGTPVANYLAGLAADRWLDSHFGEPETLAEVVELDTERKHRRAA